MSNHNEIRELLAPYALGDLSSDQAKIVTEHITQCQSCKQELENMRLVLDCAGQMSKVSVDDDMYVSAKEGLLLSLSPEKTQTQPAKTAKTIKWRTIMQSKVTKFAAAAVIILGAFLGMYMLGISPDGSSVAWASLVEHVQQIKTVRYKMHMTMKGMPGMPDDKPVKTETIMTMSSEYGMKMEMIMGGSASSIVYVPNNGEPMLSVMPATKQYMRVTVNDDIMEKMKQQSYDPSDMVSGFMGTEYIKIGRKEIDGVIVEGVEATNSKFAGMPYEIKKGRLWVDVNTNLPVLSEMEFEMEMAGNTVTTKVVIDSFQWNIELDESEFTFDIPDDYKKIGDIKMPEINADSAIEGLKMLVDMYDGKFPKSLDMMKLLSDVGELKGKQIAREMEKLSPEEKKRLEEIGNQARGVDPGNMDPNVIGKIMETEYMKENMQKMMDFQMKVQGLCMFYMQLVQEKKDPAYYGDRVTPADKDMILMRWLNDKDGYTVIFADLSTGDFTVEEVVKMELELPDRPAEVEEVHDHLQDHSHEDHPEHPPAVAPVEVPAATPAE